MSDVDGKGHSDHIWNCDNIRAGYTFNNYVFVVFYGIGSFLLGWLIAIFCLMVIRYLARDARNRRATNIIVPQIGGSLVRDSFTIAPMFGLVAVASYLGYSVYRYKECTGHYPFEKKINILFS